VVTDRPGQSDSPLVAFAGGGTGGHLYPALSLAEAFRRRVPRVRFLFFATDRAIDARILDQTDCRIVRQKLPALRRAPWRWPGIFMGYRRACRVCRSCFRDDRPMVVVGTGGLSSVPAVQEARRAGIPTVLMNPDAIPGKANRFLARRADAVFAQWKETAAHLPPGSRVLACGCPIRPEFGTADRAAGLERFGLDKARSTLLVTGASQGARTLNDAVLHNLDRLVRSPHWQVLHLTGHSDLDRVRAGYARHDIRSVILPFTHDMPEALHVADLVVSRAGASTLAEISAVGVPSILMPYPFHRDMHQLANARCLERVGAARIVKDALDASVTGPALGEVLGQLMTDDAARRAMASAVCRVGRSNAADEIAERIWTLANREEVRDLGPVTNVEQTCAPARYV